jgi:hypothetical protein
VKGRDLIGLAQDNVEWLAVVNTVTNFQVHKRRGISLPVFLLYRSKRTSHTMKLIIIWNCWISKVIGQLPNVRISFPDWTEYVPLILCLTQERSWCKQGGEAITVRPQHDWSGTGEHMSTLCAFKRNSTVKQSHNTPMKAQGERNIAPTHSRPR